MIVFRILLGINFLIVGVEEVWQVVFVFCFIMEQMLDK